MSDLCYHDDNIAVTTDVPCEYGQGLPHCEECISTCDICGHKECGQQIEWEGLTICETCNWDTLAKAAKKCALTGLQSDLKEYLRLRAK
jgi:hypothetical protein